ncbi:ABC-2 type transporter transmembrane domain-containing protein [Flavobacterium longum]|uniref:ABC transporter permease n=1 Tax=Flavobacterium longum TaxID=1299340 RepID=UPI0039E7A749
MSTLKLIIRREFISKVRNKSFIVMTFLSPLIFVFIGVVVGYLSTIKGDQKRIAIHDATGKFAKDFKTDEEYRYLDLSSADLNVVKDSVAAEHYDGLLLIPAASDNKTLQKSIEFISTESPDVMLIEKAENTIAKHLTRDNYVKAGIDSLAIKDAAASVDITLKKATGEKTIKGLNWIKLLIGFAFGYLIMMFIVIYGNLVMRSVIEEKTNRIIEIIISSVKPFQLMMGKIVGTSLAGVLQFAIWAVIGVVAMFVASAFFGAPVGGAGVAAAQAESAGTMQLILKEISDLPIATLIISFILYFVGGYFLYSSFYAAIGAAVDNETDSQQFLLPIIMPLILGVYIGFVTVMNDPHGTIATTFSMIPLTSPIVMLMRIPFGVPWWQLVLSLVILFATFIGVVWFAAKIYRVGILMYGKKPTYKELFRWLRY